MTSHGRRQRLAEQRHATRRSATTASRAARDQRHEQPPRSPPLNRPPMIATTPPSKLSTASRAASMLVAFESFDEPARRQSSATRSSACSRPVNPSTRAGDRLGGHATERRPTPAAATTSASRCRPSSCTARRAGPATARRSAVAPTYDRVTVGRRRPPAGHGGREIAPPAPASAATELAAPPDRRRSPAPVVASLVARRSAPSRPA